jgi:lipoprotein-releasing system permease protein
MVVALLVLILEKTQMIGILKALGYSNLGIRKIFLYQAVYLIGKGLFWGNLLGLLLLFVQGYFGIIQLDPASYYVNTAPVYITWWHIAVLNLGTTLICLLVLLVPSYMISRILPASAIRYN